MMKNKYELIGFNTSETIFKTYSPHKMVMFIVNNISPKDAKKHIVVLKRNDYILTSIIAINYVIFIQDFLEDFEHRKKL